MKMPLYLISRSTITIWRYDFISMSNDVLG